MKRSIGGKAAEFLRKAAVALRGKAGVLRARLLFLASLRRRAAVLASVSRHIRALSASAGQRRHQTLPSGGRRVAVLPPRPADRDDANFVVDDDGARAVANELSGGSTREHNDDVVAVVGMAELASLFREVEEADGGGDGDCHQDWTLALRSLFGDDEEDGGIAEGLKDDGDDDPSVIHLIRNRREAEGREFRIDDEIDQAADMFITRVRRRRQITSAKPSSELYWESAHGFH